MKNIKRKIVLPVLTLTFFCSFSLAWSQDLDGVLKAGKLRHLGIVYANFITGEKAGLDVELMQNFARYLGVEYEFVETNWQDAIKDLTGNVVVPIGEDVQIKSKGHEIKGDVLATGFTILPWRKKIVEFADTTFPTGIWLITSADSSMQPVKPTGNIENDIQIVKKNLKGYSVLGLEGSCLAPELYEIGKYTDKIELFPADRNLEEMIPSVMARMTDSTLMDVPVALIAMEHWPGKIKVIGPVSPEQGMAPAFSKDSPKLKEQFAKFFHEFKQSGQYRKIIEKYYPSLFIYYPEF